MARSSGRSASRGAGRSAVEEQVEEQEQETVEVSAEAAETYDRIEFLKEKVGDGEQGRVAIQRRLPDGTLASLPSLPIKTFDVDLVAEKYGGGKYEVRFYKGNQYLGYESFTIDPSVQPRKEPEPAPVPAGGGAAEGTLVVLVQQMLAELRELKKAPAAPAAAPIDPMAMIRAIGETMKSLTPAAPPPPPAAPGLAEQLALVESVVSVGTKIIDARGDGGGGGSGDMYLGAVEKLAEPITDLVKLRVQQEADRRRLNPATRRALPPPRNAVTPPAAAPAAASGGQPTMGVPAWLMEIQKWVPMIVKRARASKSAEDTAFFILDELSEPTLQELAKLAAQPDFGAQVARVLPAEMNNYPEWSTEFLAAIQDWLFGGDEDTTETEPEEPDGGSDDDKELDEAEEMLEEEAPVFDLDAEAKRRLALLDDAPPKEPTKEPAPTG